MSTFDTIAMYYDLEHEDFQEDIDFYRNFAVSTGGPVLEVACGTGRIIVPLARAGFHITGMDDSAAMLEIARGKITEDLKDTVELVRADMRDFQLPGKFRLAIIALNGLMHLDSLEDQAQSLQCIAQHLGPGGTLIVDLDNPLEGGELREEGELLLHWVKSDPSTGHSVAKLYSSTVDQGRQVREVTLFYDDMDESGNLKRTISSFNLRYLFRYEMELLLEKCGYALDHVYGSYDLDDYASYSERMIFVASKKR